MTQLGKYELHEQLGKGGFGTVYRAIDTTLVREVALKVLHPQLTTEPDFLERFRNEARMVASLDSPSIVTIYEMGEVDGRVFIAMKYLSGGSLKERLEKEGALPFDEAVKIMGEICVGLEVAHKKGLVHRDIKPANILFDSDGHAVLGDFGLAKAIRASSSSGENSGVGAGTPAYRAPELWRGKPPASPATDVYSLGCVFYEMLTGKVLFDGNTPDEIITQHLMVGPLISDELPEKVRTVLEKALEKNPEDRYQMATELNKAFVAIRLEEGKAMPISSLIIKEPNAESILGRPEEVKTPNPVTYPQYIPLPQEIKPKTWHFALVGLAVGLTGIASVILMIGVASGWFTPETVPTAAPMAVVTQTPIIIKAPTATPILDIGSTRVSSIDNMTMVYVPSGDFLMGSPDAVGEDDEHPQHTVYLDAYWIDQTEVTNGMYELCVNEGACTPPSNNSSNTRSFYYGNFTYYDYPVIYVDWDQAQAYCKWAGRQLPSEAQWEKAARGTDGQVYPWGNNSPDSFLTNYNSIVGDTTEAGNYPFGDSPYKVKDMAGNVWEWVADWYYNRIYYSQSQSNPIGSTLGEFHVLRGGSWTNYIYNIRSAYRSKDSPSSASSNIGFRCSLSASESQ